MLELCPCGVYVEKCKTYPECVCGRRVAFASKPREELEAQSEAEIKVTKLLSSQTNPEAKS